MHHVRKALRGKNQPDGLIEAAGSGQFYETLRVLFSERGKMQI
jgi:hypothetical protein